MNRVLKIVALLVTLVTGIVIFWWLASVAALLIVDRWYPEVYDWIIRRFDRNMISLDDLQGADATFRNSDEN